MMKELKLFYDTLKSRVFHPSGTQLALTNVEFGAKVLFEVDSLMERTKDDSCIVLNVKDVKARSHRMLFEATKQVPIVFQSHTTCSNL